MLQPNGLPSLPAARAVAECLYALADEARAEQTRRFFRTSAGEYAADDLFLGVRNPDVRALVKQQNRSLDTEAVAELIRSPWHEVRLAGLLLLQELYLEAFTPRRRDDARMAEIFNLYVSLHEYINNWDLVDLTAPRIVGNHEVEFRDTEVMHQWIKPGHTLWQRRISMVSTWMTMRRGRTDLVFERATALLDSDHHLLHKAAGWMLREAWKRGLTKQVEQWLAANITRIPATMLSYACEHMDDHQRLTWRRRRAGRL